MSSDFDPYYKWLGIPKDQRPPNFYQLLGIAPLEDDLDVISNACDQRMAFVRTFQTGVNSAASQKLLNEISEARVRLLNPDKKAAYDRDLQARQAAASGLGLPTATPLAPAPLPVGQPVASELKRATPMPPSRPATPGPVQAAPQIHAGARALAIHSSMSKKPTRGRLWIVAAAVGAVVLIGGIVVVVIAVGSKSDDRPVAKDGGGDPNPPGDNDKPAVDPNNADPANPAVDPSNPATDPANPFEVVPPTPDPVPTPDPDPTPDPVPTPVPVPMPTPDPTPNPIPAPVPEPAPTIPQLAAIPDEAARQETAQLVHEIYADNFANAKTPDEKLALANLLFNEAKKIKDDAVSHYVMLTESRDMAVAGGGRELALQTVDSLAAKFDVDGLDMKCDTILRLNEQRQALDERTALIETALSLIDATVAADRYELGGQLADMCGKSITALRDVEMRKKVQEKRKEFDAIQRQWATVRVAAATLQNNPDDADANLAHGRYLCLVKGDWRRGLPMLAKSNDDELKSAAETDLAAPESSDDQKALADDWLRLGTRDAAAKNFHARAHYWYTVALHGAGGIVAIEIKKRIDETDAIAAAAPKMTEAPAPSGKGDWDGMIKRLQRDGLDIVISFDSTGSMSGEINQVKKQIDRIGKTLFKLVPKTRISICTYRDDGQSEAYLVKGLSLTSDLQQIQSYLGDIYAGGGGDTPEAVHAGIAWPMQNNDFESRARKVILVFGDAPPHQQHLRTCLDLADEFSSQQRGIISTVTCRQDRPLPEFVEIAQHGGGEAFLSRDEGEIMTQLLVLVFGSQYRGKVVEAFKLLER